MFSVADRNMHDEVHAGSKLNTVNFMIRKKSKLKYLLHTLRYTIF